MIKLADKVCALLMQQPDEKLTARDIATRIMETYPDEVRSKQERSLARINPLDNDKALLNQIVAEIGRCRSTLHKRSIRVTEGRPRKYYYTQSDASAEIARAEGSTSTVILHGAVKKDAVKKGEHDLYPVLSSFLWSELNVLSRRIDEKRSSNSHGSGGNKWLYPDLVGMEDLSQDWHREVKDCVQQYAADKKTKLWSFEVKALINRSNLREAFFQAVSNSSWAHFGYLVAGNIEGGDTLKELRILAALHGIGFIGLDASNPSESQVMIPARERYEIDWNTANRLAEENKDFLDYIQCIRHFYQTGDRRSADWDTVCDND